MATFHGKERGEVRNRMGKEKVRRDEELRMYLVEMVWERIRKEQDGESARDLQNLAPYCWLSFQIMDPTTKKARVEVRHKTLNMVYYSRVFFLTPYLFSLFSFPKDSLLSVKNFVLHTTPHPN